jgi:hypothetical protein
MGSSNVEPWLMKIVRLKRALKYYRFLPFMNGHSPRQRNWKLASPGFLLN